VTFSESTLHIFEQLLASATVPAQAPNRAQIAADIALAWAELDRAISEKIA